MRNNEVVKEKIRSAFREKGLIKIREMLKYHPEHILKSSFTDFSRGA